MSYRGRNDELPWEFSLIILLGVISLLLWSTARTWACRPEQKGQFQTNTFTKKFEICDGRHWVPYVGEVPK